MAEEHGHNPLDHVVDHDTIEVPVVGVPLALPNIGGVQVTRFMAMELVAALLMLVLLIVFTRKVASGPVSKGRFAQAFEAILLFIRDGIARPAIDGGHDDHADEEHAGHGHGTGEAGGAHEAAHGKAGAHERLSDRYLPFLWTLFFFVLFCNLLGMIPGGASPTGSISVTGTLALLTLLVVIGTGMQRSGIVGYWTSLVPKMDLPAALRPLLWALLFVIEIAGLFIRHAVLAVRLFANMVAGHIVIAVILSFIAMASGLATMLVTPASVLGAVAISVLELFVAFLQAYIFTFLAALFIGTAAHPH